MNKKLIPLFITGVLSVLLWQSCQKEEINYSCDKEVDRWVKNNQAEISVMTRSEWIAIEDIVYQTALFNAFSAEQRLLLWTDKIREVLSLEWSEKEKQHIDLLKRTLLANPQWFIDRRTEDEMDKCALFSYHWTEAGIEEFGWDYETIHALIATPQPVVMAENRSLIILHENKSVLSTMKTRSEGGYGNVCNCGDDSYYYGCPFNSRSCVATRNCTVTQHGCGHFWMDACWGECKPYL